MRNERKMKGKERNLTVDNRREKSRRLNERKKINRKKKTRKISEGNVWERKESGRKGERAN